jgi:beta-fructofuranosidase
MKKNKKNSAMPSSSGEQSAGNIPGASLTLQRRDFLTTIGLIGGSTLLGQSAGAEAATKSEPKSVLPQVEFGYRPDGMTMWDPWFVAHEGQVHLFHLQRRTDGSTRTAAEADHIGHAVTRDLIHWTELPLTVGPGEKGGMEDMQPWTGCAVVQEGVFHLFYTMRSTRDASRSNYGGGGIQRIGLATSDDLVHWQRYPKNPVLTPDPRWYVHEGKPEPGNKVGCRDMKIIRDPVSDGWIGFYAATVPAEEEAEAACIAVARSKDLIHWEQMPPAFHPKRYGEVEAHDVFPLRGKWWMTCLTSHHHGNRGGFSDPNIVRGSIYAVADFPEGPYREPLGGNILLGGDLTAGGTVSTVEFEGKRYAFFQEGPFLSQPLELNVSPEGWLRLMWSARQNAWRGTSLVPAVLPAPVNLLTHHTGGVTAGKWELAADGSYRGKSRTGWQVADLGFGAADMEVEATVTLKSGIATGFVLRADRSAPHPNGDFVFALDAQDSCVFGASLTMFSPMNRRQFKVEPNHAYHLRLCSHSERYQLYVDGELILHGGFPKEFVRTVPGLGLFVDRGETVIKKLAAYRQEPNPSMETKSK